MFAKERWAAAFINLAAGDIDNGLGVLRIGLRAASRVRENLSGDADAGKLEKALRRSMESAGVSGPGPEYACRLLCLLVRKGRFSPHSGEALLEEIERLKDRASGALTARLDSAFPLEEEAIEQVKEWLRRRMGKTPGAKEIKLLTRVAPELLGGYRLQIGSESIDASLRFLLRDLASHLQAAHVAGGMA